MPCHPGQTRQEFTQVQAGHGCPDGVKWATDVHRNLGFEVEGFQMTRATIEPDKNAATGLRLLDAGTARLRAQSQELSQSQRSHRPQTEKVASFPAIASLSGNLIGWHGVILMGPVSGCW